MSEFCDDERECKSHHVASLWISEFSNTFCDINDLISMRFDCRMFIKYVKYVKQIEDDREIDKKRSVSMQRVQIRTFLIWLKLVRESDRLVCEKIRYFQHYLFFLIEFLFSFWSSFCFAKSRCNNCIVRFLETILREREHLDQYTSSKLYCLVDCFFSSNNCSYSTSSTLLRDCIDKLYSHSFFLVFIGRLSLKNNKKKRRLISRVRSRRNNKDKFLSYSLNNKTNKQSIQQLLNSFKSIND